MITIRWRTSHHQLIKWLHHFKPLMTRPLTQHHLPFLKPHRFSLLMRKTTTHQHPINLYYWPHHSASFHHLMNPTLLLSIPTWVLSKEDEADQKVQRIQSRPRRRWKPLIPTMKWLYLVTMMKLTTHHSPLILL